MKVALLQMVSSDDWQENLAVVGRYAEEAARGGAELLVLPENFYLMGKYEAQKLELAENFSTLPNETTPIQYRVSQCAKRNGLAILAGTMPIHVPDDESRVFPRTICYDRKGDLLAYYDKRHLFDVDVPEKNERYLESNTFVSGRSLKVFALGDQAVIGLSICYDLRFPEHFRALVDLGANVLVVPSAFTESTGRAHWHTLLRARAIENLCYVIAPNQGGKHSNGRATFGHSVIYDPWGNVLAEAEYGESLLYATLDFERLHSLRQTFPVLTHRKPTAPC